MISPPSDPASLDLLNDIVMAEPISWYPPAPGWILLSILIFILLFLYLLKHLLIWKSNAYRRAALNKLNSLKISDGSSKSNHVALCEAAEILKRTALVVYPRENVAGLSGDEWIVWLNHHGGGALFENEVAIALGQKIYQSDGSSLNSNVLTDVIEKCCSWVRHHKVEPFEIQRGK